MKPKWLIEDFAEDNNYFRLADEVKRQGYDYELITYTPFQSGSFDRFSDDECVIVVASLQLAGQLLNQKKWTPNAWLNLKQYECSYYYAHLGKYLFNDKYIMLPRTEAKRRITELFEMYGKEDCIFIRPSSGFKTFTGKVFSKDNFDSDWKWVDEFTNPEDLVIVSTPKDIKAEWRFVIAEGEVISGSMYKLNKTPKYKREWFSEAINLANEVAKQFSPDPMYVLDICQGADDNFYLLEIGSFSCAGLYSCDVEPIVRRASEIALKAWTDIYEM